MQITSYSHRSNTQSIPEQLDIAYNATLQELRTSVNKNYNTYIKLRYKHMRYQDYIKQIKTNNINIINMISRIKICDLILNKLSQMDKKFDNIWRKLSDTSLKLSQLEFLTQLEQVQQLKRLEQFKKLQQLSTIEQLEEYLCYFNKTNKEFEEYLYVLQDRYKQLQAVINDVNEITNELYRISATLHKMLSTETLEDNS